MGQQAELVFAGGAIYTADADRRQLTAATRPAAAARQCGRGRRRPDRGHRQRGRQPVPGPDGAGHRGRRPARPGAAARFPGRARASGVRRRHDDRLQPDRRHEPGRGAGPDRGLRRAAPGARVDRGLGLADGVVPGGTPDRRTLDRVTGSRPAYLSNRDGHGAWANTARLEARRPRRADARPGGRPDRARAQTAGRRARCTRARRTWSAPWCRS